MDRINRNSPCVCGSGYRFKACCGAQNAPNWNSQATGRIEGLLSESRNSHLVANEPLCDAMLDGLPPGIFVSGLDGLPWKEITAELVRNGASQAATIRNEDGSLAIDRQRVTRLVDISESEEALTDLVKRSYLELVAPFFGKEIRWLEKPQLLRYEPGGYYAPHSDADMYDEPTRLWKRIVDRDLSLLIYLDDDFKGGELIFPNFNYRLRPRAGMLVAFPSDSRYFHGAMPVTEGVRHALVSWASVHGPELLSERPRHAVPIVT